MSDPFRLPPPVCGRGETGRRRRLKIAFPWSAGSSPAVRTILLALVVAACDGTTGSGPIAVSVIGSPSRLGATGDQSSRLLTDALAQGLVRFDAAGQIEPGLAERWIVTDEGMSYIFRLRDARWSDGSEVTAAQVVDRLNRQVRSGALKPFLTAIDEIVVMTPQVIEVRLHRPRPDLLKLFAQPELAIVRRVRPVGTGPMQLVGDAATPLLRPLPDPDTPAGTRGEVRLTAEPASLAVARFVDDRAALVTGGGFADWPLVQAAGVPAPAIRIDPAAGLFGLAIVRRDGFLADAANRAAVAQAIDATAVIGAVAATWTPDDRLLPDRLDSAAPPQAPAWRALTMEQRLAASRASVVAYRQPVRLRIALPQGPGATRLWGRVARALLLIGIVPDRVAAAAPADLRLVDAVAPYDSARWYLATACQPCGDEARAQLEAAREAPTLAERAQRIAAADAALTADIAFIPLARPWRWSLVSPRLRPWALNSRAWHPLNRLLADPT